MKILWEIISFLLTPFVRHSTRPQIYRNVIVFTIFALLFAQCFSHDLTTDKPVINETQTKWLNDNRSYTYPVALDARVVITKRQSPTKLSNSLPLNQNVTKHFVTMANISMSTERTNYHDKISQDTLHGDSVTTFSPISTKLAAGHGIHHSNPINNVLILIQTKKNIELNLVRDQFHQFIDTFGIKLPNLAIDFDAIDGKQTFSLYFNIVFFFFVQMDPFTHNVSNFTLNRFVFCCFPSANSFCKVNRKNPCLFIPFEVVYH